MKIKIELPTKKAESNINPEIEFEQLVIVGANGSGKTRFGSDIERRNLAQIHRISAQKSLTMPNYVSTKSIDIARGELIYGGWSTNTADQGYYTREGKLHSRWGNNINTFLLNDYEKLMVFLHSEEYEEALFYKENDTPKPKTKLDVIQQIWEKILPHRKLIKRAGIIETYPTNDSTSIYNASEMSDGERVIFYLIGEVISAPKNSIIIFDEPEMHIHKSLIKRLFDLIENERTDCAYIYLTHDLDFATSRHKAQKIWAKSYFGNNVWDYEILEENNQVPEHLYLEILGSRNPILFVEGDNDSIDTEIYEQIFDNKTIKPLGSCEKVIQIVKALNEHNSFHHLHCNGIIDRDTRQTKDVENLTKKNVWVLDVAEAENLLLIEEVIRNLASYLGINSETIFNEVKLNLLSFFEEQLETQVLIAFKEQINRKMLEICDFKNKNISDINNEIDSNFTELSKIEIYDNIKKQYDELLINSDYDGVLRVFNLKNALIPNSKVCELLGLRKKNDLKNLLLTILKRNDETSEEIKNAINQRIIKNVV